MMADTQNFKLVLVFSGSDNEEVIFSYEKSKSPENISNDDVKTLVNGIIANSVIFENPPITAKKAYIISTTTQDIDLDD